MIFSCVSHHRRLKPYPQEPVKSHVHFSIHIRSLVIRKRWKCCRQDSSMRRIENHVATLDSVTMVFGFVSVRRQQDCSITALFAGVI